MYVDYITKPCAAGEKGRHGKKGTTENTANEAKSCCYSAYTMSVCLEWTSTAVFDCVWRMRLIKTTHAYWKCRHIVSDKMSIVCAKRTLSISRAISMWFLAHFDLFREHLSVESVFVFFFISKQTVRWMAINKCWKFTTKTTLVNDRKLNGVNCVIRSTSDRLEFGWLYTQPHGCSLLLSHRYAIQWVFLLQTHMWNRTRDLSVVWQHRPSPSHCRRHRG